MSASARDRLGERLRKAETPSPEDLEALQQLQQEHAGMLRSVVEALRQDLHGRRPNRPFTIASRVKTVNTLLEKLRRGAGRLSKVQDIAGVRIVSDFGRARQDRLVAEILQHLGDRAKKVDDLRDTPRFGYRAVHVVGEVDGFRVEIQSRTVMQQWWADTTEHLADRWGRGIRYGEPPEGSTEEERQARAAQFGAWQAAAVTLANFDEQLAAVHLDAVAEVLHLRDDLDRAEAAYRAAMHTRVNAAIRATVLPFLQSLGPDVSSAAREALILSPVRTLRAP
jgi:ppGpp synthetase/RelA/SpoT-type nucleotidyltranferase